MLTLAVSIVHAYTCYYVHHTMYRVSNVLHVFVISTTNLFCEVVGWSDPLAYDYSVSCSLAAVAHTGTAKLNILGGIVYRLTLFRSWLGT